MFLAELIFSSLISCAVVSGSSADFNLSFYKAKEAVIQNYKSTYNNTFSVSSGKDDSNKERSEKLNLQFRNIQLKSPEKENTYREELSKIADDGVITKEEFNRIKKEFIKDGSIGKEFEELIEQIPSDDDIIRSVGGKPEVSDNLTVANKLILTVIRSYSEKLISINGKNADVSGMVKFKNGNFLVVHDGKKKESRRVSVLNPHDGSLMDLKWPGTGEFPIDIEAITEIKSKKGQYMVLTSSGYTFIFDVAKDKEGKYIIQINENAAKPTPVEGIERNLHTLDYNLYKTDGANYEAFFVWNKFALIGERGGISKPGTLYISDFDRENARIGKPVRKIKLEISSGKEKKGYDLRDISDVTVRNGEVKHIKYGVIEFLSATDNEYSNPENFSSDKYRLGVIVSLKGKDQKEIPVFIRGLTHLENYGQKMEAITKDGVVASDDEGSGKLKYFSDRISKTKFTPIKNEESLRKQIQADNYRITKEQMDEAVRVYKMLTGDY